jgi:hypothetical protein
LRFEVIEHVFIGMIHGPLLIAFGTVATLIAGAVTFFVYT